MIFTNNQQNDNDMMNLNQLTNKLSAKGFRRTACPRTLNDEADNIIKVYDFEHRKQYDVFSVYLDENENVLYAEYTKVSYDPNTRKFNQQVSRIDNAKALARYLN